MSTISRSRRLIPMASAVAVAALILAGCSSTNAENGEENAGANNLEADIAAGSVGTVDQFSSMADICPSEGDPITVGVVDGIGTNSGRRPCSPRSRAKPHSAS